jgi:hypothetical protein
VSSECTDLAKWTAGAKGYGHAQQVLRGGVRARNSPSMAWGRITDGTLVDTARSGETRSRESRHTVNKGKGRTVRGEVDGVFSSR